MRIGDLLGDALQLLGRGLGIASIVEYQSEEAPRLDVLRIELEGLQEVISRRLELPESGLCGTGEAVQIGEVRIPLERTLEEAERRARLVRRERAQAELRGRLGRVEESQAAHGIARIVRLHEGALESV